MTEERASAGARRRHNQRMGAVTAVDVIRTKRDGGVLTDEQLQALRDASGADFDRLFLEGMIQHHEGAIAMADVVAVDRSDDQVTELANEIVIGQGAEIDRMRDMLEEL